MFFINKKGFTLFELIITISIIMIICTIALPHFHQYMASQERIKTLNTLRNSIQAAKNMANPQSIHHVPPPIVVFLSYSRA